MSKNLIREQYKKGGYDGLIHFLLGTIEGILEDDYSSNKKKIDRIKNNIGEYKKIQAKEMG